MRGKIKFYNGKKKFGFITSADKKEDYFFHWNDVIGNGVKCRRGEHVEFVAVEDSKKPGSFKASEIKHPSNYESKDFKVSQSTHPSRYLLEWAYIPLNDQTHGNIERTGALSELAEIALEEDWSVPGSDKSHNHPVLHSYLLTTFYKQYIDKRVVEISIEGRNYATFNTGLVNEVYEPIFALFESNDSPHAQPWKFLKFCTPNIGREGTLLVRHFHPLPEPPRYFENADQVVFDPDIDIIPRFDHILYDGISRGRFPDKFLQENLPTGFDWEDTSDLCEADRLEFFSRLAERVKSNARIDRQLRNRLRDAIDLARKRASWNYKTAIPLYYPRFNSISLVLPIDLLDEGKIDLALVISRTSAGGYSAETVYKLNWAYKHARLVCRPESDWLIPRFGDDDPEDTQAEVSE